MYNTALSRLKLFKGHKELFVSIDQEEWNVERNEDHLELKIDNQKRYIHLALEKLEKQDSLLLTLFYLSELLIDEIEEVTSLSVSNIKVRLHWARKKLLAELKNILKSETLNLL